MLVKLLRSRTARLGLIACLMLGVAACRLPTEKATAGHIQRAAEKEGQLLIYGNMSLMAPVITAFEQKYPTIDVQLVDMNSHRMVEMVKAEAAAGQGGADMVWSSAMDAQIKLINDGYAQSYRSPHLADMPNGSVWRHQGFGITAETVGFAYNRNLLPADAVPTSHTRLLQLLQQRPELFRDRVTIYDVENSSVAMMYLSAENQINPQAWDLIRALGQVKPRVDTSGHRMMQQLVDGRMALVHNVNLSFAQTYQAAHPQLELVVPDDYHLSVSRVAMITHHAPHPNAAKLFLDYLMSREGQAQIAALGVRPVRDDLGDTRREPQPGARPIRVGPGLLANSDQARRVRLLKQWREAVGEAPRAPLDPKLP